LVFIPQGVLSNVPWSALFSQSTGRYLIEDHPLTVSPSASLHAAMLGRARSNKSSLSLLAIGDPAFDYRWHPHLAPLPSSRQEVEAIAHLYGRDARVFLGRQATPGAVTSALQGRDVIHFATHTLIDDNEPDRSVLVLAPAGLEPDSGDLTAAAVHLLPLSKTYLVVLSSCSGAAGPHAKGEGTLSLVRSFLSAGAPTVIAGLWPVDDRFASEFFVLFHERLRAGEDPAGALRDTQLHFLRAIEPSRRSFWFWGGFQTYGVSDGSAGREIHVRVRPYE
jgi:CHAT domain-containing protein